MDKPKSIAEVGKLFEEKFIGEANIIDDGINGPYIHFEGKMWSLDNFVATNIKQFWLEHFRSLLEEMRMEDKPLVRRGINTFEDGQVYGEIDGYNTRNAEINKHLDNLLSKGEVK